MVEIIHELAINGEKEKIYEALTTKNGLSSWWTQDVKTDERIGSTAEFGFYGHKAIHYMKILDLKPSTEITWMCEQSPIEEWNHTEIKFSIKERDPQNPFNPNLRFVQSGYKSTDKNYGAINFNWAKFLTSLKDYIETGKGTPNTT